MDEINSVAAADISRTNGSVGMASTVLVACSDANYLRSYRIVKTD
jgi:hypothetical protein